MNLKKSELYAYIGTAISVIIIVLIMIFVFLPGLQHNEDDGVMISFGESFDGGGTSLSTNQKAETAIPQKSEVKEDVITQKDKSASVQNQKNQNKPTQSQSDKKQKQDKEMAQKIDNLVGGSFGSSNNAGSGQTSGNQVAGNPVGKGNEGGHSWAVDGRNLLGTMPSPSYNQNVEGYITVSFIVDESGKVTKASITRSTISDQSLREAAMGAALRTRFSSGTSQQPGTITYNFKLK
ncbi:hypothetical protein MASR2M117_08150 [Paludibacter sp.]